LKSIAAAFGDAHDLLGMVGAGERTEARNQEQRRQDRA